MNTDVPSGEDIKATFSPNLGERRPIPDQGVHWVLAHVDVDNKSIFILNSKTEIEPTNLGDRVKALSDDWKRFQVVPYAVPQQGEGNFDDCGVYVCYFMEQLYLDPTRQFIPPLKDGPNAYRRHIAQKLIEASAALERVGDSQ